MTLVFGSSTTEFNNQAAGQDTSSFTRNINHLILYFVYLFVARFVIGYIATLCICIAAARTTCALRRDFLEKLLRQEVSHFDKAGNGSPATQVTTSARLLSYSSSISLTLY
jgi:ATP-binding cassette subfamily B (MDR/TAP) protein 1